MGDLIAEALAEVDDSTLFALFVGTICGCSGALAVVLAGFCWHSCARAGQQCRLLCTFGLLFMAATIVTATWLVWWWWRPVAQPGARPSASECEEELRVAERRLVALEAESAAEADADEQPRERLSALRHRVMGPEVDLDALCASFWLIFRPQDG